MFSKLFHEEVFMPTGVNEDVTVLQRNIKTIGLSRHFEEQHVDTADYKHSMQKTKIISAVMSLTKNQVAPFEVQLSKDYYALGPGWHVTKYVVRVSYDETRDVTIVIATNPKNKNHAFVKTAWLNDKQDVHKTLNKIKYHTTL